MLIFSDIHIHPHKKSLQRLHDCLNVLEWVFKTAKERNIQNIVFAGDLFQDRQKIDILTYNLTFDALIKHLDGTLNLYLLLGNHDLWFHDKWDISSVKPFASIPGVTIIDKPMSIEIDGTHVDFLPYTHDPVNHLMYLKSHGHKTLVAHLAIDEAKLNVLYNTKADVVLEHDGDMIKVDTSLLAGWENVFLGHYHAAQHLCPTVEYVGSPLQLNFGEAFQHKNIIVFEPITGKKEYIRNTFSPQHFIIDDTNIDDFNLNNNFLQINTKQGKADIIDLQKKIEKENPGSLEFIKAKQEDIQISNSKAILYQDITKMLDEYLKIAPIGDLKHDKLVNIGNKITCKI